MTTKYTGAALILAAALTTTACEQLETPTGPTLTDGEKQAIASTFVTRLRIDAAFPANALGQRRVLVYALGNEGLGMGNQPILLSLSGDGALDRDAVTTDAGGVATAFFTMSGPVTITAQHAHTQPIAVRVPLEGAPFEVSPFQ